MVRIYTFSGCSASRKLLKWLNEREIDFEHVHTQFGKNATRPITKRDIYEILKRSEHGFDDIISKHSVPYRAIESKYDELSASDLIAYIVENPNILKRPISMTKSALLVGFNTNQITTLVPREKRRYDIW